MLPLHRTPPQETSPPLSLCIPIAFVQNYVENCVDNPVETVDNSPIRT